MPDLYLKSTQHFHSILDFLRFGYSRASEANLFYGHGTDNAWDEIRALVLGSLALPFDLDPMWLQASLTNEEKALLCERLSRRIHDRVPVPYLTHEAYFCGLSFYVDERVLIPRSPIAELIEQQFSPWIDAEKVTHVLDLCTGSGCIAIACCEAFPQAQVDAVDISDDALAVADMNRRRHGLEDELTLIKSDCFDAVPPCHYDLIVSNPPYVSHDEMRTLPDEYRHEPNLALEAMDQGLAMVANILRCAASYLSEQGILVVEVGNTQDALLEAYPEVPFTWLDFERGGHGVFLLTREQLNDLSKSGVL